ncbi:conjugative relaxase-like TrwC/TraI family protein, partial [Nocardia sp. GAS34]|uniref:MobF family relaxase n=1 Tax=unclassified Nocardia TaxID=2637762 RepID=UPI003D2478F9
MTATLHKIFAGNGYLYYLRQVAPGDTTDLGTDPLGDYYSARGESPGVWHGSGLTALNLSPGDPVTEEQMRALFGEGRHPNAEAIQATAVDAEMATGAHPDVAARIAELATRLGNPYRVYSGVNKFRQRCAEAFAAHNIEHGKPSQEPISEDIRARIRTDVATEMFTEHYERAPLDARELSGWVTRISRPQSAAVAGIDITFSPVKSVSALWAIAPKHMSERIAAAHHAAVDDALEWLERNGIYTRLGRNGIRQVEVEGIVAARFFHRESRCGDPDCHTHVVIANRVRTLDGRWRTLDASMIYKLLVTVSEIYNTRLEHHLEADVGLEFAERPGTDPGKRPIREIIGMPRVLIEHWSRRDAAITARLGELATIFQRQLGREPMPSEMYDLAERATLETRPAKHVLRSWAQQRADWRAQASALFGGREVLARIVSGCVRGPRPPRASLDGAQIVRVAEQVLATVSAERSTWQAHHVRSEAERCLRGLLDRDQWAPTVDAVVAEALAPSRSIPRGDPDIAAEPDLADVPTVFARSEGSSVHSTVGAQSFTSARRLGVADRLIELSLQSGARTIPEPVVTGAIQVFNTDPANKDRQLNAGQIAMVNNFASSPWRIETSNAPAGAGKTTAMRVLVDAWRASGGTVLGFAPTAAAAAVLAESTGARTETIDKLLTIIDHHAPGSPRSAMRDKPFPASLPQWALQIDGQTLVIVDEHVRLGDDKRLRLFEFLAARHATIRCVGDDKQLPSIEAGGTAANTADAARASTLTHVVRFASTAEAAASLLIRDGDPAGLGFYLDHGRIHAGAPATVTDQAYTAWFADHVSGRDTVMLAPTHITVNELNARARADRLARATETPGPETELADTLCASAGDIICTRHNDPRLRLGDHDWVRNGYRWIVTDVRADGSLAATHLRRGRQQGHSAVLPAAYVRAHVRLGYAMTIDSAQGITADTCHIALTGHESRNQLYVALTRGMLANHLYVPTAIDGSEASFWTEPGVLPRTAVEMLQRVLARDASRISPHTELRDALDPHSRLGRAVDIYLDAAGLAAEHALGPDGLARLDTAADALVPHLTDAPAYPVLRQHLAVIALTGRDPIAELRAAAAERELDTAKDAAAVLDWRLDSSGAHSTSPGPLPWVRGLPDALPEVQLTAHLRARARLITRLAEQITADTRTWTPATAPVWARPLIGGNPRLLADLAVWRAANHLDDTDLRPTGPTRYPKLERAQQLLLDARTTEAIGDLNTAANTWSGLAKRIDVRITTDPWWPVLADRLDTAARAGLPIDTLLTTGAQQHPLPDEMPAAALWFRLDLEPATLTSNQPLRPAWTPHLHHLLGHDTAEHILADPTWPRIIAAIDRATDTDWTPHDLLTTAHELLTAAQPDHTTSPRPDQLATALAWRIEALLHPDTITDHPPTTTPPIEPSTPTTTMNDTSDMTSEPSTPDPGQISGPQRLHAADSPLPQQIRAISDLFSTGHVQDAVRAFRQLTNQITAEQRDILERVATTLYTRSYPVAKARLLWAAEQHPQHAALITACIPATDPRTQQTEPASRTPQYRRDRPHEAARDHDPDTTPLRPRAPITPPEPTPTSVAAYLITRTGTDDDPDHMPIPHGFEHHYPD